MGDFDDDLTNGEFKNGTTFTMNNNDNSDDEIIYQFGESWKIKESESIINYYNNIVEIQAIYCNNQSFNIDFTYCSQFLNDDNYENNIIQMCGDKYQCIYDASFANKTLEFALIAEETIKYLEALATNPPTMVPTEIPTDTMLDNSTTIEPIDNDDKSADDLNTIIIFGLGFVVVLLIFVAVIACVWKCKRSTIKQRSLQDTDVVMMTTSKQTV